MTAIFEDAIPFNFTALNVLFLVPIVDSLVCVSYINLEGNGICEYFEGSFCNVQG